MPNNASFEDLARDIISSVDKLREEMYNRGFSEHDLREPLSAIEESFGRLLSEADNADCQEAQDV